MKTVKTPVIKYSVVCLPIHNGGDVEVYEDGLVRIKRFGGRLTAKNDHKAPRKLHVSPEKIREYADRIVESGFFNFSEYYDYLRARGGVHETFELHYMGRSKSVRAENANLPSNEFKHIIEEITGEKLPKSDPFSL